MPIIYFDYTKSDEQEGSLATEVSFEVDSTLSDVFELPVVSMIVPSKVESEIIDLSWAYFASQDAVFDSELTCEFRGSIYSHNRILVGYEFSEELSYTSYDLLIPFSVNQFEEDEIEINVNYNSPYDFISSEGILATFEVDLENRIKRFIGKSYFRPEELIAHKNMATHFTNFTGYFTSNGTIIITYNSTRDISFQLSKLEPEPNANNLYCNASFAGWTDDCIVFETRANRQSLTSLNYEANIITGQLTSTLFNTAVSDMNCFNISSEIRSCIPKFTSIINNVSTVNGGLYSIFCESYCCNLKNKSLNLMLELYPIYIHNFSLDVSSYIDFESIITVDISDDMFLVDRNKIELFVNDIYIDNFYTEEISNGYRVHYKPSTVIQFSKPPLELLIKAENSVGNKIQKSYNLTFGYIVEYNLIENYQNNKNYDVLIGSKDQSNVPKLNTDVFIFKTIETLSRTLGATINSGVSMHNTYTDISADIYPESTAYFYGKNFNVRFRISDYNKNSTGWIEFDFSIRPDL